MKESIAGSRNIILATNIAESSITVPNVGLVIDFCLQKSLSYLDQTNSGTSLLLEWAPKSSCEQRAGRTGRTITGEVIRLVPSKFYEKFPVFDSPETEKMPLEDFILRTKLIGPNISFKELSALSFSPKKMTEIKQSIVNLKQIGAMKIYKTQKDGKVVYDEEDSDLTFLGTLMAVLPIDIKLSKFIALGLVLDVFFETVVIAAIQATNGRLNALYLFW